MTRTEIKQLVQKLKGLIQQREYVVWVHGTTHLTIAAGWEGDTTLTVCCTEFDSGRREALKKAISFSSLQSELAKWEKEINEFCQMCDQLGWEKYGRKLRGRFFEELLAEVNK